MADDVTLNAGSGGDVIAADDIGPGVKYQRVKLTLGADGVNDGDVASGNPLPIAWTGFPSDVDDDAVAGGATAGLNIAVLYGWDGTDWGRVPIDASSRRLQVDSSPLFSDTDDGTIAAAGTAQRVLSLGYGWDGTNWIRAVDVVDDDDSLPTGSGVRQAVGLNYGFDGTTWVRLRTDPSAQGSLSVAGALDADGPIGAVKLIGVGVRASTATPSAVSADNDVAWIWSDLSGRLKISGEVDRVTDTITAQDDAVTIDCSGAESIGIRISGTWSATLEFEATVDNTQWIGIEVVNVDQGGMVATTSNNQNYIATVGGFRRFRVRASAYTSGTVDVTMTVTHGGNTIFAATLRSGAGTPAFQIVDNEDDSIVAGSPHAVGVTLLYGYDGTAWERIVTDTAGRQLVVGGVATGASAASVNPVILGGVDESGNAQAILVRTEDDSISAGAPQLTAVGLLYGFDGGNWERIVTDASGRLSVVGQQAEAAAPGGFPVLVGADDGSVVRNLACTSVGELVVQVLQGQAGHDNPVSSVQPIVIGGRGFSSTPTAVSTDGDAVWAWFDLNGAQVVVDRYTDTDDDSVAAGSVAQRIINLGYAYNGSAWSRILKSTAGGGLLVEGTDAHDAPVTGNPVRIAAKANSSEPSGISLDGDACDLWVDPSGRLHITGQQLNDSALNSAVQAPVAIGGRASANEPTAVSADGDSVWAWMDQLGRLVVVAGHPAPETPVVVNATASGTTQIIAAPGASVSLYIKKMAINNGGASVLNVGIRQAGGSNVWEMDLAADGGGANIDFGDRGWKLTANTALQVDLGAAGDCWVNVLEYYIAA